jgi:23S rRNA-/tRNA-specific pseudouridylate synthase
MDSRTRQDQGNSGGRQPMSWSEVHQDRWVLVVDKPYGLPTQSGQDGGPNLFDMLREQHHYVGLHHRLDTPASGLVLFTLHKEANRAIARGFRRHTIERTYQVVVLGDPGAGGRWEEPIDGKTALTHYTRITTDGMMSVLDVQLQTGRTHQIRRHATTSGHPVIGDRRHGGAAGRLWPRLALHASGLTLDHPVKGPQIEACSPIPEDLRALWSQVDPSRYSPAL